MAQICSPRLSLGMGPGEARARVGADSGGSGRRAQLCPGGGQRRGVGCQGGLCRARWAWRRRPGSLPCAARGGATAGHGDPREQSRPELSLHLMEVTTASTLQMRTGVHIGYPPPQAPAPRRGILGVRGAKVGREGLWAAPQGSCGVSSWNLKEVVPGVRRWQRWRVTAPGGGDTGLGDCGLFW